MISVYPITRKSSFARKVGFGKTFNLGAKKFAASTEVEVVRIVLLVSKLLVGGLVP
jgi:hypothetical protein